MPALIDDVLAGKKALDVALWGVRGARRAFAAQQDSLGRLFVLLHADFGDECNLDRDVFYSWRTKEPLRAALTDVLAGDLVDGRGNRAALADLIEPRLVLTPADGRKPLAERLAQATFRAAPIVVEGGGEATRLLLAHIDAVAERLPARGRRKVRALHFNLPLLVTNFTGREDALAALDRLLEGDGRAVVTQAITGLGGVGKSQLAARYVHEHLDAYDIVAWIRTQDGGIADLAALASELSELPQDLTIDLRAAEARQFLTSCPERWLLVLDNLAGPEQLAGCCPSSGNGRVLVTTRNRAMAQYAQILSIEVFDQDTAVEYLLARAGRPEDRDAAGRLARALGCLPLALAHAGAYCAQGTGFDEYLQLLDSLPTAEVFNQAPEVFYRETVASTWHTSIDAAAADAALARDMLAMAALLAPENIPRSLFSALIDSDDPKQRKALIDAAAALHRFSLAVATPTTLSVHRLLQRVVRESATATEARIGRAALNALTGALPTDPDSPRLWPTWEMLLPHTLALASVIEPSGADAVNLIDVLNGVSSYLLRAGSVQRAIDTTTIASGRAESLLGPEHPATLTASAALAFAYWAAGRTVEAIAIEEQVLADRERLLGAAHPATLTARNNLASSYQSAGRTTDAIPLQEQVLADLERLLGAAHPDTLTARSNLASYYQSAGRTTDAITLKEQVLADRERLLGAAHPDTLTARNNLASSYHSAGRTTDAITLQEQVLADRERLLGAEHPDTLAARGNLASSYRSAGRTTDAIPLQEQVLADRERLLGAAHPATLTARNNLASSYQSAGRTTDAIPLQEQVLADLERLLGAAHPDTLTARSNLASSYQSAGRTTDAIPLQEQVLADRERLLGAAHPATLTARNNLASSYQSAGRTTDAIPLQEQVLADLERLLGAAHPDTLAARGNLASSYWSAGRTTDAITLQQQVLADLERLLGAAHPDTLTARNNLASYYQSAGRTTDAITLQQQVLADLERLLGAAHPDTLTARSNLASYYQSAGRTTDAITLQEQVLADLERLLGAAHPDTLTARNNLASSYHSAGRTTDAITLLQSVLADRERLLGSEHPDTLAARNNLASSYWSAGRTTDAIPLQEQVLADVERLLGAQHPATLTARHNLAVMRGSSEEPV